jgi:hypothetical protein
MLPRLKVVLLVVGLDLRKLLLLLLLLLPLLPLLQRRWLLSPLPLPPLLPLLLRLSHRPLKLPAQIHLGQILSSAYHEINTLYLRIYPLLLLFLFLILSCREKELFF